jgi:hypothetical protein
MWTVEKPKRKIRLGAYLPAIYEFAGRYGIGADRSQDNG